MTSISNFLKNIDTQLFESILDKHAGKYETEVDTKLIEEIADAANIASFKKSQLMEYLDANKDKLLARVMFKENDPVRISDDFAPRAGQHGVVLARGTGGMVKVKFDDAELDMHEMHLIHSPAPETEVYEDVKGLALAEDFTLTEIILPADGWNTQQISEQLDKQLLAVLPMVITEELKASFAQLLEAELTPAQSKVREDIMFAAKDSVGKIEEHYGEDWADLLYAAATFSAISESADEAAEGESGEAAPAQMGSENSQIFSENNPEGDKITIDKSANGFTVNVTDKNDQPVESKSFSTVEEAERLAQSFM